MRDAEGLVKVQVADVRANVAGRRERYLRVHVRSVHVDLATERMDESAELLQVRDEHVRVVSATDERATMRRPRRARMQRKGHTDNEGTHVPVCCY